MIKSNITATQKPFKRYNTGGSLGEKEVRKVDSKTNTNTRKTTKDGDKSSNKGNENRTGNK